MRQFSVAIAALVAAGVITTPAAVADPGVVRTGATTPVTGAGSDGSFLGGFFTATDFGIDPAGRLIANGVLDGVLTAPGMLVRRFSQRVGLPVDRQNTYPTNCRMVDMALGPAQTTADGVAIEIKQTELTITIRQGPGSLQVVPLCQVSSRLRDPNATDPGLLSALNGIVAMAATQQG